MGWRCGEREGRERGGVSSELGKVLELAGWLTSYTSLSYVTLPC